MLNILKAQVPPEWETTKLGDVVKDMLSGGTPSTKNSAYWKGSIPWITSKWLNDNLYLNSGEKFISQDAIENSASKIVPSGNLIFATRVGVGKVAVNKIDLAINQDLAGIVIDKQQTIPEFLAYQLRVDRVRQFVEQNKRGATIKGITKSCLSEIELLLPSLLEQRRIAAVLSLVQKAIEEQKRLIELTTELKKTLMHRHFTEGTRGEPQKETEIGPIPESWDVVEIGDVFKFTSGKTKPKDTQVNRTDTINIPVYGGNGILGYSSQFFLDRATLILGRVGEYCGCAHLTEHKAWVTDNALYVKQEKQKFNLLYIKHHFEFLNLNKYSNKMGQPLITQGIINKVKFGLPYIKEQEELADIFNLIDRRIENLLSKKNNLIDLFCTLLHQLMTAQIRVNDLDLTELEIEGQQMEAG